MRISLEDEIIVGDVLEKLIETQPNSYIFAIEKGSDCFVGATPERLVKVTGNELLSTCLAGTAPRGETKEADEKIGSDLLNDAKNCEEHEYVVQMIKESIDPACENIYIPDKPVIYPLANLQYLYTPVTADFKEGNTIIDLVKKINSDLLNDAKNREEHEYVVQMNKESIDSACENINIPDKPVIYPLANLQHLYTPVTADLKEGNTINDLVKKLHPTPALGGLPSEAALQFIRDHERLDRGWYGAPVGWLDDRFNGEFAVAIRSGLIQADEASIFAGCGVMKDSVPEHEYEETNVKFLPMLNVLEEN